MSVLYLSRDPVNRHYFEEVARQTDVSAVSQDYELPFSVAGFDAIVIGLDSLLPEERAELINWLPSASGRVRVALHTYDADNPQLDGIRDAGVGVLERFDDFFASVAAAKKAA